MRAGNSPSPRCPSRLQGVLILAWVLLVLWNASFATGGPLEERVFAQWNALAPRVRNMLLEAKGTITFRPGADMMDGSRPMPEPITRPIRLRLLVDFPKIFL